MKPSILVEMRMFVASDVVMLDAGFSGLLK
jgi:hypothetical protein